MMAPNHGIIFILGLVFCAETHQQNVDNDASVSDNVRLLRDLTEHYDPAVKPVRRGDGQITVGVGFTISRVEKLEERSQTLTSFGYLNLRWQDELLVWNPARYGGIRQLVLLPDKVWLPEIEILNSVQQIIDVALSEDMRFRVMVQHTGEVLWTPYFRWETYCPLSLAFFPFDQHECEIYVVSWNYNAESVNLTLYDDSVGTPTSLQSENNEWIWNDPKVQRMDYALNSSLKDSSVPVVSLRMRLERAPAFYIFTVLLPTVIIAVISGIVYLVPPSSGEKISFSITVLLSYFVILLMISDMMPRSGNTLPFITYYITVCMLLTALSLILTVLVLNMYHHHPYKRVPAVLRGFAFGCLSRILCLDRDAYIRSGKRRKKAVMLEAESSTDTIKSGKEMLSKENGDVSKSSSVHLDFDEERDLFQHNQEEWQLFARVLDRLFLLITLVTLTMLTVIFLVMVAVTSSPFDGLSNILQGFLQQGNSSANAL